MKIVNTVNRLKPPFSALLVWLGVTFATLSTSADPLVRMKTAGGEFFIDLTPDAAPATVENFLAYVNSGAFNDSIFHRSVPGFIVQSGSYFFPTAGQSSFEGVPTDPPVVNEFNQSNVRGTVAMAKLGDQPDSATSGWFVNLADNGPNLDNQNGGFTVFGTIDSQGMQVIDAIAALPVVNLSNVEPAWSNIPVLDATVTITRDEIVQITNASEFSRISAPAAAILPASRAVGVSSSATGFATIVNSANADAASCRISPSSSIPASFVYRQTNPNTNAAFGPNNPLLDIDPLGAVSVVFSLTPTAPIAPTTVEFDFTCANASSAASLTTGVNTFDLSASTTPGSDVVALAATANSSGTNDIPSSTGSGAFAVATVNVGAEETITVTADTGDANLPVALFVCPTDPITGSCTADPAVSSSVQLSSNETATFSVFAQLLNVTDTIEFAPAANRAFVRFKNAAGDLRGSTSVALRTVP